MLLQVKINIFRKIELLRIFLPLFLISYLQKVKNRKKNYFLERYSGSDIVGHCELKKKFLGVFGPFRFASVSSSFSE